MRHIITNPAKMDCGRRPMPPYGEQFQAVGLRQSLTEGQGPIQAYGVQFKSGLDWPGFRVSENRSFKLPK